MAKSKNDRGLIFIGGATLPIWDIGVRATLDNSVQINVSHASIKPLCGTSSVFLTMDYVEALKLSGLLKIEAESQRILIERMAKLGSVEKKEQVAKKVRAAREDTPPGCDHVFRDSPSCAKCGWRP